MSLEDWTAGGLDAGCGPLGLAGGKGRAAVLNLERLLLSAPVQGSPVVLAALGDVAGTSRCVHVLTLFEAHTLSTRFSDSCSHT